MLYELLVGRAPFDHHEALGLLAMHASQPPPPLSQAAPGRAYPDAVQRVVDGALAKDPADRLTSVAELRAQLQAAVNQMGRKALNCQACTRPADPDTGLCGLHGSGSRPAASSPEQPAVSSSVPPSSSPPPLSSPRTADGTSPTIVGMAKPSRDGLRQRVFGPGTVSRESEAAQVVNFLLGDRPLLELSGRSGSGKTTLLDGVAATAEALDYRVLRMWPDPQLASRPWYPVRQMIGELLGCGPTPRTEHRLTELAAPLRLDPDHIDGLKALFGLALVEHSEEGVEQAKLIRRSVAACLAALPGGPSGTCLVADDALEYDRASQRLLRSLPALLGPRLGKLAVVADGAFFASRTDRAHLPLGGLDVDGIASLLEARNTDRNIAEMAQFVADVSAGNTLNVTQAVLAASEGGHLGLPLSEPIAWRIGQLPEADRRMLQVVSALGCQVPMSWLDDLTRDGPAAPVVEALQAKEMVRVDASGAVSPTHATVAALALQRMDSLARDALHGELLDLLKRDGQSVFVLAHHAYEVETEKAATDALDLLTRAGDSARRWADVETAALIHYEKAVQVARWRLLLRDHDPRFVELSLRLGQAQAATDHRRAAEVTLRDVVAGADRDARLAQLASNTLGELSSR